MKPETLDVRGLNCPLPVLRSRKAMRGLAPGALLMVEATDPLSVIDLPNWAREDGHRLVEYRGENGVHFFLLQRGEG